MTMKDMAKKNYDRGLWTNEMVAALVRKGLLTAADYSEIVGTAYPA